MVKAIIYRSNSGHTEDYAKRMGKKLNIPCYTMKEAKKNLTKNDEIVYLCWICASRLCGAIRVKKKYNIVCYGAVGTYPKETSYTESLRIANNLDKPFFYLRGGIDYKKLNGFFTKTLKMVGKAFEKEATQENQEMIQLFKEGGNYVSDDNIEEIVNYIKQRNEEKKK